MPKTLAPRTRRRAVTRSSAPFRILVATTGEPDAQGAVTAASLLARRTGAAVDVLTVVAPFPHLTASSFRVAAPPVIDEENRHKAMVAVQAQLATRRGTRQWKIHAAVGWPTDAIVEAARAWHSSLIVVGLGHHGALDRLIGSETAITIARNASVPLLAVPEQIARLPMHAIAAVDFTPSSEAAARLAANIVSPTGLVSLLHASALAAEDATPGSLDDVYTAGAHEKLEELARDVSVESGRKVRAIVSKSAAVDAILSAVENDRCDLIALGSHARGLIDRMLSGSVQTRVMRRADCPVLVVPG